MATKRRLGLKFCPDDSDLLYPQEDKEARELVFVCRSCGYRQRSDPSQWCVYVNEIKHKESEQTVIMHDIRGDPTLPRTKDVRCPACNFAEAVFYQESTPEGATLYYCCIKCGHRWHDAV